MMKKFAFACLCALLAILATAGPSRAAPPNPTFGTVYLGSASLANGQIVINNSGTGNGTLAVTPGWSGNVSVYLPENGGTLLASPLTTAAPGPFWTIYQAGATYANTPSTAALIFESDNTASVYELAGYITQSSSPALGWDIENNGTAAFTQMTLTGLTVTGALSVNGTGYSFSVPNNTGGAASYQFFYAPSFNASSGQWLEVAVLPVSTAGTRDNLLLDGVDNCTWLSTGNTHETIVMGNRNGFQVTQFSEEGSSPQTCTGVQAYQQTDGSVDVYAYVAANSFGVFNMNAATSVQETLVTNATPTTSTPPGTLVFDSTTAAPGSVLTATGAFSATSMSATSMSTSALTANTLLPYNGTSLSFDNGMWGQISALGLNVQGNIGGITTGFLSGPTVTWNETNGLGESDIIAGQGLGSSGGLYVYAANPSGALSPTTPIMQLSGTGSLTVPGTVTAASGAFFSGVTVGGSALTPYPTQCQLFTSSGTWTRLSTSTWVTDDIGGGGGGGGGGVVVASGGSASGGGGGGSGFPAHHFFLASSVPSSVAITIGAGGTAGAAGGASGGVGGTTTFGSLDKAPGGGGGQGGASGAASGGGGSGGQLTAGSTGAGGTGGSGGGYGGGSTGGSGAAPSTVYTVVGPVTGGGGGSSSLGIASAGSNHDGGLGLDGAPSGGGFDAGTPEPGGKNYSTYGNGVATYGLNGTVSSPNGTAGAFLAPDLSFAGGGGSASSSGAGGNGGASGYGAGGPGGGDALTGQTAGAGSTGGGGYAQICQG